MPSSVRNFWRFHNNGLTVGPGGFLAGLIIPHENGFAISLVEKIEDVVSLLLLPLVRLSSGILNLTLMCSIVLRLLGIKD